MDDPEHKWQEHGIEQTSNEEALELITYKSALGGLVIAPLLLNYEGLIDAEGQRYHHREDSGNDHKQVSLEHVVLVRLLLAPPQRSHVAVHLIPRPRRHKQVPNREIKHQTKHRLVHPEGMLFLVVLLCALKLLLLEEFADIHVHCAQLVLFELPVGDVKAGQTHYYHERKVSFEDWVEDCGRRKEGIRAVASR